MHFGLVDIHFIPQKIHKLESYTMKHLYVTYDGHQNIDICSVPVSTMGKRCVLQSVVKNEISFRIGYLIP